MKELLRLNELVLMKLGGSVITDKNKRFSIRADNIRRIARETKRVVQSNNNGLGLVLGHGGGSFPHFPAQKYRLGDGIIHQESWRGFAQTRAAASKLNQIVIDIFLDEGVNVVSFQPSASAICGDGRLVYLETRPIKYLLGHHQIPMVYGDVALDWEKGCTILSTEQLFCYLAERFKVSRIILIGEVEGVFTDDPLKGGRPELIEEISSENITEITEMLSGSHGIDVTGGMLSKITTLYNLVRTQPSIEIRLISGSEDGLIEETLLNRDTRGTLIHL